MVLHPSGLVVEDVELVVIETSELSLYIKGKPYHERYENFKSYRQVKTDDRMEFMCEGIGIESLKLFDVDTGELSSIEKPYPIFFENGMYQLVVMSKKEKILSFHHEHPGLRKAIGLVGRGPNKLLMGNLHFPNEVGYSTFEIHDDDKVLLKITIEIFPSKLDYKEDYRRLLNEVNEEVYNLAYHFVKRTYLASSPVASQRPTWSEFYRLLDAQFDGFLKSIKRIELQPHHALTTTYQKKRGDQLGRLDSYGRDYLRKRPNLFHEVEKGVKIHNRPLMPTHGMSIKKSMTYDTLENRFVKWMIKRLILKLENLYKQLVKSRDKFEKIEDNWLLNKVDSMKKQLQAISSSTFWRNIGVIDKSVMSLVLQMAPGYRDAYRIYLIVSKGLILNGRFYQMSVKDVALLYEYWTFLKLGQILARKYIPVSQDIVKVTQEGLFVNLDQSKSAKRVFKHPITNEEIILYFQKAERSVPTVPQKPDTMLSIEKKGKDYTYNYIFDAKYRIDLTRGDLPGPLEEDINTMHRYRDALVIKHGGPYEREAFGAYVLFPGFNEDEYESHSFYKSINEVNIGGLPFLPNATRLVEQFIEHLIEKGPEEILDEGILPKGTKQGWISSLDDMVMVANVKNFNEYVVFKNERIFLIPVKQLKKGWQQTKYIALYLSREISKEYNGVYYYSEIEEITFIKGEKVPHLSVEKEVEYVCFKLKPWDTLGEVIRPVQYGISVYIMTTLNTLKYSNELPELFMKSNEEVTLWRMLRRISNQIKVHLDDKSLDDASNITYLNLRNIDIQINHSKYQLEIENSSRRKILDLKLLDNKPSIVFKEILGMVEE